ncbi:hypothetical protein CC78DRAFT_587134 [Lojkania enalia]|uniref:Uncharacterized protein n=1 Tax=Lojkania enalia TaxID=147567 RepID=A0A9P4MXN5_9PLEO|nr:hypothetical protein CC78DRAFT_587134 [Didymosphaeria enalia]
MPAGCNPQRHGQAPPLWGSRTSSKANKCNFHPHDNAMAGNISFGSGTGSWHLWKTKCQSGSLPISGTVNTLMRDLIAKAAAERAQNREAIQPSVTCATALYLQAATVARVRNTASAFMASPPSLSPVNAVQTRAPMESDTWTTEKEPLGPGQSTVRMCMWHFHTQTSTGKVYLPLIFAGRSGWAFAKGHPPHPGDSENPTSQELGYFPYLVLDTTIISSMGA